MFLRLNEEKYLIKTRKKNFIIYMFIYLKIISKFFFHLSVQGKLKCVWSDGFSNLYPWL